MEQTLSIKTSKSYLRTISIFLLFILLISGCASPGKRTAIGAGAGAGAGALIGGLAGGGRGALIGGALGATLGGVIGNRLDKQAQELAEVAQTQRTQEGILVNLKNDLLFDTGSSTVKPEAEDQLRQLGNILVKYPKDIITIAGFTDNVGNDSFNQTLSMRRATAVKNILTSQGVPDQQMKAEGYGKNNPIAKNDTKAGRIKNRRVELHIRDMDQVKAEQEQQQQVAAQQEQQAQTAPSA
jgi:outer membrane protein OmpA-like peptidoglycan-associated protein